MIFAFAGVELVHKRTGSSVEADDRGDVPGPEEELGRRRRRRAGAGDGAAAAREQASTLPAR